MDHCPHGQPPASCKVCKADRMRIWTLGTSSATSKQPPENIIRAKRTATPGGGVALREHAAARQPRKIVAPRKDEGARRRAQQRELMRRLLEAESAGPSAGPDVPMPLRAFIEVQTPPLVPSEPEPAKVAEPVAVSLSGAVASVLSDLDAPMSIADLIEWLAESGVEAGAADVEAALKELGSLVTCDEFALWKLAPTHLDASQRSVVHAPLTGRLIVVAGPGAGKTEVACARVAHAVESGVPARSIVLISFTRAATAELTERIAKMVRGGALAMRGVEIRTLDSLAWMLQRHLTDEQLLTGSYADNTDRCIEILGNPPAELQDYIDSLRLVLIDEAQDIVGTRSELAVRLLAALPQTAGVTIFADPAQAIFGDWALDEGRDHGDDLPLHERLESGELGAFRVVELTGLHRTSDPTLLGISVDLRTFAMVRDMTATEAHVGMHDELVQRVGIGQAKAEDLLPLVDPTIASQFFLFRTKGEVVQLSSYMSSAGIPHRLRFPGLPRPVYPWIGRLLGEWEGRRLSERDFAALWMERVHGTLFDVADVDAAWALLIDLAGDESGRLDVLHLREIIARGNPPDEVLRPTLGAQGPILGTIHGSKGREAEDVVLGLTEVHEEGDPGEEARVLYVGATRARRQLRVAEMRGKYAYLNSRRAWAYMNRPGCARLLFGLEGDVIPLSPVDRTILSDTQSRELQDFFATPAAADAAVYWRTDRQDSFRRHIRLTEGDRYVGLVGPGFVSDMWQLGKIVGSNLRPGDYQRYLQIIDYTTVARDNDSPDLNQVTEPYAASGFWVAPLVKGFGGVCLSYGGSRN